MPLGIRLDIFARFHAMISVRQDISSEDQERKTGRLHRRLKVGIELLMIDCPGFFPSNFDLDHVHMHDGQWTVHWPIW